MDAEELPLLRPSRAITLGLLLASLATAQTSQPELIRERMAALRLLPAPERGAAIMDLALGIRDVPSIEEKLALATDLVGFATEGDNGSDTLQALTETLIQAIGQAPTRAGLTAPAYLALATLARYEGVPVTIDDRQYRSAMRQLESEDRLRESASFSLKDMSGKKWTLRDLRGKVVLVNFWATWCLPCRFEFPELEALHKRFHDQGLVVLAISDEDKEVLRKFLAAYPYSFPILPDPGRRTGQAYRVRSVPQTFVYDREGRLVAMALDQRTEAQLLDMLAKAGLH